MKKILFFLVVPFALIGCKQKSSTEGSSSSDTVAAANDTTVAAPRALMAMPADACDYYLPIKTETHANQLAWLISHKDSICANDEYKKCLVRQHMISDTVFNDALKAYWNNTTPVTTSFALSTFTDSECDFVSYHVFQADKYHKIKRNFKAITSNMYGFSVPFFKGIALAFDDEITGDPNLIFTQGRIDNKEVIIFKVDGIDGACFDFSQNPCGRIN